MLISAFLSRSTTPFNDNGLVIKMEKKASKDNSSVLQIFKFFIQLKGDFAMAGGKRVVDAVFSSRGQFKPFCLTHIGLVHERLKNASVSTVLWYFDEVILTQQIYVKRSK